MYCKDCKKRINKNTTNYYDLSLCNYCHSKRYYLWKQGNKKRDLIYVKNGNLNYCQKQN
jgi:Zn finger protein HypA/HybF involved in hydrogenase expression